MIRSRCSISWRLAAAVWAVRLSTLTEREYPSWMSSVWNLFMARRPSAGTPPRFATEAEAHARPCLLFDRLMTMAISLRLTHPAAAYSPSPQSVARRCNRAVV